MLKSCVDCGRLIPYGKARCPECEAKHTEKVQAYRAEKERRQKRERDRRYNRKRDPKYKRFYNSREWKELSAYTVHKAGYRCQSCGRRLGSLTEEGRIITLEVDHIEPIQSPDGWDRRLDRENLQVLCGDCHNAKHKRFTKKGRNTDQTRGVG